MARPIAHDERPLRVLHVVWRLSTTGGIQRVVRALADAADPSELDVWIASVRPALVEDELDRLPVHVEPVGLSGRLGVRGRLVAMARLAKIARRVRPDVLHLHSGTAYLAVLAVVAARPRSRVLDIHDAPGNGRHGRFVEWLEGWLVRHMRFTAVVHSASVAREVVERWCVDERCIEVVPLGIDVERFRADPDAGARWRTEHEIASDELIVVYVARPVPSKNVDLFVQTARAVVAEVPRVRFVLIGGEATTLELDGSRQATEPVRVINAQGDSELIAALSAANLYCSTSAYEGFGLSIVEAMATGLPVVATAVGGVTDVVVDGETGLLVGAGDRAALHQHLVQLLNDSEMRFRLGDAGRRRVRERFDVAHMAGRYNNVYRSTSRRRLCILKSPPFDPSSRERGDGSLPYRADSLRQDGFELRWTDAHLGGAFASRPLRPLVQWSERAAAPWLQTTMLLPEIARSDATLAFFESEGHFLAALRALPGPQRHGGLVILTCWLADILEREAPTSRRTRAYRAAYTRVDRIVCFSSNQVPIIERALGLGPGRVRFVPFGIDLDEFTPNGNPDGEYVVAVGRDRGRDWKTFFAAAESTGLPTLVACRPSDIAGLRVPKNVDVLGYVDRVRYRRLLADARVSVVPTHERVYPTGQTVLLESFALGRASVVTDTPAIRSYVDPGTTALVTPVADVHSLAAAICRAWDDVALRERLGQAGRRSVEETFNAENMWREIADIVREVTR